jgi:hypothetical protein
MPKPMQREHSDSIAPRRRRSTMNALKFRPTCPHPTPAPHTGSKAFAGLAAAAAALLAVASAPCLAQPAGATPASTFIDKPATVRSLQLGNPTLGVQLSQGTRFVYEPRPVRPWADGNPAVVGAPAEAKLGLEFKTVSASTGAKNLLRVQLSASSALQFRPRGGGMNISYRAQF